MSDMMHDWLFTLAQGDGSGPLRVGPHYGSIPERHGRVIDKGTREEDRCQVLGGKKTGAEEEEVVHERIMKTYESR